MYLALDEVVSTPEEFARTLAAETVRVTAARCGKTPTPGIADDGPRSASAALGPDVLAAVGGLLRLARSEVDEPASYGTLLAATMRFPAVVSEALDLPLPGGPESFRSALIVVEFLFDSVYRIEAVFAVLAGEVGRPLKRRPELSQDLTKLGLLTVDLNALHDITSSLTGGHIPGMVPEVDALARDGGFAGLGPAFLCDLNPSGSDQRKCRPWCVTGRPFELDETRTFENLEISPDAGQVGLNPGRRNSELGPPKDSRHRGERTAAS